MQEQEKNTKDFIQQLSYMDDYGNNINFPDSIMSDMTIKGLLGKWTHMIYSASRFALCKYYMKNRNIDVGDKNFVISLFKDLNHEIHYLTHVLEDLVEENIYGIEDIFIAVFGIFSDEVYVLQRFIHLTKQIESWNEDHMWDDCAKDKRLKKILLDAY